MRIRVLGSGGCVSLPRPLCKCKICEEAREKGEPYKRTACSIFIEDENILIDTPEDIVYQLNREKIEVIKSIFYSHWDPDHTLGIRVLEQVHESWRRDGVEKPINVSGLNEVIDDIRLIRNKFSSYLDYYEYMNLCKVKVGTNFNFNKLNIELFEVKTDISSTIFLFTQGSKKVIYAPCDIKPFRFEEKFYGADLLIIGAFVPNEFVTDKKIVGTDIVMYSELYTLKDIIDIKEKLNIKNVVITHLEEEWKLSYDDYKKIEDENEGIKFAYDSMRIFI